MENGCWGMSRGWGYGKYLTNKTYLNMISFLPSNIPKPSLSVRKNNLLSEVKSNFRIDIVTPAANGSLFQVKLVLNKNSGVILSPISSDLKKPEEVAK